MFAMMAVSMGKEGTGKERKQNKTTKKNVPYNRFRLLQCWLSQVRCQPEIYLHAVIRGVFAFFLRTRNLIINSVFFACVTYLKSPPRPS
jgi:hypothetical protein